MKNHQFALSFHMILKSLVKLQFRFSKIYFKVKINEPFNLQINIFLNYLPSCPVKVINKHFFLQTQPSSFHSSVPFLSHAHKLVIITQKFPCTFMHHATSIHISLLVHREQATSSMNDVQIIHCFIVTVPSLNVGT